MTPTPCPVDSAQALPIRVLVPAASPESMTGALRFIRNLLKMPFDSERVAFLTAFSSALLNHPKLRRDPACAALGYWLRRANLAVLESEFRARIGPGKFIVPAGLVFHVAPANVDTMFAYSWALSFLAGNANVVRLTTRPSPLLEELLVCLNSVFVAHPNSSSGNWFITYERNDEVTARFSMICDTRIVWGGDDTVGRLRAIPLNPHAAERSFFHAAGVLEGGGDLSLHLLCGRALHV